MYIALLNFKKYIGIPYQRTRAICQRTRVIRQRTKVICQRTGVIRQRTNVTRRMLTDFFFVLSTEKCLGHTFSERTALQETVEFRRILIFSVRTAPEHVTRHYPPTSDLLGFLEGWHDCGCSRFLFARNLQSAC